jgi:hypothetical protein
MSAMAACSAGSCIWRPSSRRLHGFSVAILGRPGRQDRQRQWSRNPCCNAMRPNPVEPQPVEGLKPTGTLSPQDSHLMSRGD